MRLILASVIAVWSSAASAICIEGDAGNVDEWRVANSRIQYLECVIEAQQNALSDQEHTLSVQEDDLRAQADLIDALDVKLRDIGYRLDDLEQAAKN